jgi:precorrin-8X/cobalt-precorrin-8 methylmutase
MLFDSYLTVDWSARAEPKSGEDSIWIGHFDGRGRLSAENPRTRCDAAWRAVWNLLQRRIEDSPNNKNNRFKIADQLNQSLGEGPGPFWGCPSDQATKYLTTRKKELLRFPYSISRGIKLIDLAEYRITESFIHKGVQSVWKLFGNGAVGSQVLTGIPRLAELRYNPALSSISKVWPFETGFTENPSTKKSPVILHAEIWPGILPRGTISQEKGRVNDEKQVKALCRHFANLDGKGRLGSLFATPNNLTPAQARVCVEEEGWILGA